MKTFSATGRTCEFEVKSGGAGRMFQTLVFPQFAIGRDGHSGHISIYIKDGGREVFPLYREDAEAVWNWANALEDALHEKRENGSSLAAGETPAAWTFKDDSVAQKFDDHVREQLAWYDATSQYVADMAVNFVPRAGVVYDIGASTGNITRLMKSDLEAKAALVHSIEPSHQMAKLWRGHGDLLVTEAERVNFGYQQPDLAVMFLVLMFMPPAYREVFMEGLCRHVKPGGAVIVVDKGYLYTPGVQIACKSALFAAKKRAGASGDAIMTKELSLRGEQRPTDSVVLNQLFERHNFASEQFFQFGEFYGLLAIKRSL